MTYPTIDARAAWAGNRNECGRLYRQWRDCFAGSFAALRRYYGWTRPAMVQALRIGQTV